MFSYDKMDELKAGDIPNNTIELYVGMYYNKPIKKGVLPNLRFLHLGTHYNMRLEEGCLPESLEILILGMNYNVKFKKNVLPSKLKHLSLGECYSQDIEEGVLPNSLEKICFGRLFNFEKNRYYIPVNVRTIKCNGSKNENYLLNNLPSHIEKLYLYQISSILENLPITLKELYIDNFDEFNLGRISKIPFGCEVFIVINGQYTNINDTNYKYQ
jgi:hypothetical protein